MTGKKRLFVVGFGLFAVFVFMIVNSLSHTGKVYVKINVFPEDALIQINGQKSRSGVWLKPDQYRFSAEKDGFTKDEQTIRVSYEASDVYLIPTPSSEEARRWASQEDVSAKREVYGGLKASIVGESIANASPIIELLPKYDIAGPYSIDYGLEPNNHTFLLIGDSTPTGRQRALQWIRDSGFNPSELDIRFDDFTNPTLGAQR